jgi:hypothetical protein
VLRALNRQLIMLSRVVLHPSYRGSGIGHRFIRRCCELCAAPWIETLTQMGHANPVFERAGFQRLGQVSRKRHSARAHAALYCRKGKHGDSQKLLSAETHEKSRYSNPVYYLFDNRKCHVCQRDGRAGCRSVADGCQSGGHEPAENTRRSDAADDR